MKKILVFCAYYEPEVASSMYLTTNLLEDLAKEGYDVEVFTPVPTRGVDKETRAYYKKNKKIEENGNLHIHRIGLIGEGKNPIIRAFRYVMMNIIFIIKSLGVPADAIFVDSTPPTQGAMAAIIKKIKKIPFIYNLQDVFPDSMTNMGMITQTSLIFKIGRLIENFTYKHADRIIVISNDMKDNIKKKNVPEWKIQVVSNWVDTSVIRPIRKEKNYLFEKFNINSNNFNIVYAGNLGYAQNIDIIIDVADMLKKEKNIHFVIFGKGAEEERLKELVKEKSLENINFYPIQPYSEVSYVYSLGDACIVTCKKGFGNSAMPSKTWSIMATGTPILASFDQNSDMEKIIESNGLGFFSKSGDLNTLANNILKLYNEFEVVGACMGEREKKYVKDNASREVCTKKYIESIQCVLNHN